MPNVINEKTGNIFAWPVGKPLKPGHRWVDVAPRANLLSGLAAEAQAPTVTLTPEPAVAPTIVPEPPAQPASPTNLEESLNAMKKVDLMAFCQHQWGKSLDISTAKAEMVAWALEQAATLGVVL